MYRGCEGRQQRRSGERYTAGLTTSVTARRDCLVLLEPCSHDTQVGQQSLKLLAHQQRSWQHFLGADKVQSGYSAVNAAL